MKDACIALVLFLIIPLLHSQTAPAVGGDHHSVAKIMGFEEEAGGPVPVGWYGAPDGTVHADKETVHSGKWSARLERKVDSPGSFSVLSHSLPVDFVGDTIQLRGFLKTEDVKGFAGLWLREDGDGKILQFDNMQRIQLNGTTAWTAYTVTLPLDRAAREITFGALLVGTGQVWVDDLDLVVDGKPVSDALAATPPTSTVLDRVHDFDGGSGVTLEKLDPIQVENLEMLGRIWGFLKYHHPAVAAGKSHWDYEMVRVLPLVLKAGSRAEGQDVLVRWIDGLGSIAPCKPCMHLDADNLGVKPDLAWLHDKDLLGEDLSKRLQIIYENRPGRAQFYISPTALGGPQFDHELAYPQMKYPDAGFQLLALFRFWNIMQYWAPDREIADQDWPLVLREFIPRVMLAKSSDDYQLAMMALIAKANDTHANLWSSIRLRPPVGECQLPVNVRFIEGHAVISSFAVKEDGVSSGFKPGDVVEQIDGVPVTRLVEEWRPFYADSNEPARLRDIGRSLTKGACGEASVSVRRGSEKIALKPMRVAGGSLDNIRDTHDLPGETFRMLSKDIAYLKLSSVKAEDVSRYMNEARATKGLIVDIRNYPSASMVFALGQMLVTQPTPFVALTLPDIANPGAFLWGATQVLTPATTHYGGKVVILVDEVSQSHAEYTAMALQASPNAVVVGSTTAGADGNVSEFPLPGGMRSMISGLGVYYPDKSSAQRVGVRIDVPVTPTIAGVAAGRDEVLEMAIRQIVATGLPQAAIEQMARP